MLVDICNRYLRRFFATCSPTFNSSGVLPFHSIPGPKPLPLVGNLWRYLPLIGDYDINDLFGNAQYNRKRYGPIVREQITKTHTILHLFDPSHIEALIRKDLKYPKRRSHRALAKYRRERPDLYLDGGLFPENGDVWFHQRKKFEHRLVDPIQLNKILPNLDRVSRVVLSKIQSRVTESDDTEIKEFQLVLNKWALANALVIFADVDAAEDDALLHSVIENLNETLDAIDYTEMKSERWLTQPNKCPFYQKLTNNQNTLYSFVLSRVDLAKQNSQTGTHFSYLRTWLHEDKIDQKLVITFVMDCLLASLHTTTYTLAFLLYHITSDEKILKTLRDEMIKSPLPATYESIKNLRLLAACVKETTRLNPVSIGTGRVTQDANLTIGGYQIPEGMMAIAHTQLTSLDEAIYDQPGKFMPDRWASYRKLSRDLKPSPYATQPFGFWPRACIGQRVAELQIKFMAMRLLKLFDIKFRAPIRTRSTLVHNIDGDIVVNLTRNVYGTK